MSSKSFRAKLGLLSSYTIKKSVDPEIYGLGTRIVDAKVEIDFTDFFGVTTTETFTGDDITSMSILEEAVAAGGNPLGFVSSNEFSLSLNNSSRKFTPKNLSDHIFYRPDWSMFDKNSNTIFKFTSTGPGFYYGVPYWSGITHEEFVENSFKGKKIAITSAHNETITFKEFWIYSWSWWDNEYEDYGPVTFEPYERKEFIINNEDRGDGLGDIGLDFTTDESWNVQFTFAIQEIEILDEEDNNQAVIPTSTSYNSAEYYLNTYYIDEIYTEPDEPLIVKPGLEIRPFIKITDELKTSGYVPLGTFWCGDWSTPTNSLEAKTTAYDRLLHIISMDTPQIPVMVDTTIGQMFGRLFRAIGLEQEDYIISPALTQTVRLGWFPRDTIGTSLQLLAEAGSCHVFVNRNNQIVVMPNVRTAESIATYTDRNSIFSINNPQQFLDIYTAVKVIYKLPYLKDPNNDLVKVDKIKIPPGETVLDRIDFNSQDIPIMQINWVYIYGDYNLQEKQTLYLGAATGGTFKLGRLILPAPTSVTSFDGITPVIIANMSFSAPLQSNNVFECLLPYIKTNQSSIKAPYSEILWEENIPSVSSAVEIVRIDWTNDIPYNADEEAIQNALETIYGEGTVTVKRVVGSFVITFNLTVKDSNLTADFTGLTGAISPSLERTQKYVPEMTSKVVDISYGATDITLTIENTSLNDEEININVKGIGTGFHDSHRTAIDEALIAEYGRKEFSQENPLIQDRDLAEDYSNLFLAYVSDPLSTFNVDFRGDPTLKIGDIITVISDADQIESVKVVPRSIRSNYAGNLRSQMIARRVI